MTSPKLSAWLILWSLLLTAPFADNLFIPLDDRPANRLFVQQLGRVGQPQLTWQTPDRSLLGNLQSPGSCERLSDWAHKLARQGDTAIICSDMWIYGGLVASRSAATRRDQVEERLENLRQLGRKGVKITVIATIARLSLRTSAGEAPYETALANWAAKDGLPTAETLLDSPDPAVLPANVPWPIVKEYLEVRARQSATLKALVSMASQKEIEHLVLGQDDSHRTGIHVEEQARLRAQIIAEKAEKRVKLLSGIDELSMNVLAGLLVQKEGRSPSVRIIYSDPDAATKTPPMESLTLEQMIDDHLALSGARLDNSDRADVDLFIYTPSDKPYVLPGQTQQAPAKAFVKQVQNHMKAKRRVAVADLSLINRMDPFLAQAVLNDLKLPELEGFASWNTPANAVGTVIAQLVCHHLAKTSTWPLSIRLESEKTHQAFLFARMLDDYGYQTLIRDAIKPEAIGLSPYANPLLNEFGPVGLDARLRLIEWAHTLYDSHYQGQKTCLMPQKHSLEFSGLHLEVVLPWTRIFEVEARVDLRLKDTGRPCP